VDRGERLGLGSGRWPFYFGGRAGVLGTVGADVVAGLTPVQAILAGPGSRKAAANGWQPPYPEVPDGAARLAEAERRTVVLAGQPYGALRTGERAELITLLGAVHARWGEEAPVSRRG
jgi:hypothetical protein